MHPLQMLLLHALRMEERVMIGATGSTAGTVGLIQVIGRFLDILGSLFRCDPADVASEALLQIGLLLVVLAATFDG